MRHAIPYCRVLPPSLPRKHRMLQRIHVRFGCRQQRPPLRRCIVKLHSKCQRSTDEGEAVGEGQASTAQGAQRESFGVSEGICLDLKEDICES